MLNTCGFWSHFHQMFQHAVKEGFISESNLDIVVLEENVDKMLDKILSHVPPAGLTSSWGSLIKDT